MKKSNNTWTIEQDKDHSLIEISFGGKALELLNKMNDKHPNVVRYIKAKLMVKYLPCTHDAYVRAPINEKLLSRILSDIESSEREIVEDGAFTALEYIEKMAPCFIAAESIGEMPDYKTWEDILNSK